MTKDEQSKILIKKYQSSNNEEEKQTIIDEIYDIHNGLIRKVVMRKYNSDPSLFNDKVNHSVIALVNCVRLFDFNKNVMFSSYLGMAVEKYLSHYFFKQNLIKITKYDLDHGFEKFDLLRLDKPIKEDLCYELIDKDNVLEYAKNLENKELLNKAINVLNNKEIIIINSLFFKNKTLKEIGDDCKISVESVRFLKKRALQKMKRHLNNIEKYKIIKKYKPVKKKAKKNIVKQSIKLVCDDCGKEITSNDFEIQIDGTKKCILCAGKKINILFLDIDGVLNSARFFKEEYEKWSLNGRPQEGAYKWCRDKFQKSSIKELNRIIKKVPDLKIVISSSWKNNNTLYELKEKLFKQAGINPDLVIDMTPNLGIIHRGKEIIEWLNHNKYNIINFVILDDNTDMDELSDKLVKTTWAEGLTEKEADEIIKRLNS